MGKSSCVGCGECVAACPTGALLPPTLPPLKRRWRGAGGGGSPCVVSLCPYCGVGCQLTYRVRDNHIVGVDGRDGPANHGRLCVKGRYGYDYPRHPQRLTRPLIRKPGSAKSVDNTLADFRAASWEEALDFAADGPEAHPRARRQTGAGRLRLGQGLERGGLPLPEAGAHRLRHEQRRPLHAAVPCLSVAALLEGLGSGAVSNPVADVRARRRDRRHRRQPDGEPPGRGDLDEERGGARRHADRHGPARDRTRRATPPHALQFKPDSDVALLNAIANVIVTRG
jgi:formate dehydrogenase major subunit